VGRKDGYLKLTKKRLELKFIKKAKFFKTLDNRAAEIDSRIDSLISRDNTGINSSQTVCEAPLTPPSSFLSQFLLAALAAVGGGGKASHRNHSRSLLAK